MHLRPRDTQALHGLGDWLTNGGRVTRLLAGYGVVVVVALMAPIPPLERGIGAASPRCRALREAGLA